MFGIRSFSPPETDKAEIARYMRAPLSAVDALVCDCLFEAKEALSYRLTSAIFPLTFFEESADNGLIDLSFAKIKSKDLYKNLTGSESAIVFAATVGIGIERLAAKYSTVSPAKSLCFEAIGNERVERLCDAFNREVNEKFVTSPRFSPGYGDLDLSVQRDIFRALSCEKIGLSLKEDLIMSPAKSVTAIIGVRKER